MNPLEQAKAIYFARCDEVSRLAEHFEEDEVIDLIARAIMAERERCIAVAGAFVDAITADDISEAIRGQS